MIHDPTYVTTVVGTVDSTSCTPFSDYATMATVPSQRMKASGLQMNAQRHVATVVMATVSSGVLTFYLITLRFDL